MHVLELRRKDSIAYRQMGMIEWGRVGSKRTVTGGELVIHHTDGQVQMRGV